MGPVGGTQPGSPSLTRITKGIREGFGTRCKTKPKCNLSKLFRRPLSKIDHAMRREKRSSAQRVLTTEWQERTRIRKKPPHPGIGKMEFPPKSFDYLMKNNAKNM